MSAGGRVEPEEAEPGADQRAADHGKLAGALHEMDLQIVGKQNVADEIGDEAEGGGGDHHRHDGEAVEAVGQVHGVAGADDDEGAERNEQPAEIDQHALEEGNGERGRERLLADIDDDGGGDHGGGGLDDDLDAAAEAFGRLLGHFEIVVVETDGAIDEGEQQHDPDIRIAQIAPEQHGDGHAGQDHQAAHGGRALLLQEMALGAVFADRLTFALADTQGPDHLRPEQEHEQKRREQRPAGAEGDVTEDVEDGELRGQARSASRASALPLRRPVYADAASVPKRRFSASTSGAMRLPSEPLTMIASPGPTARHKLGRKLLGGLGIGAPAAGRQSLEKRAHQLAAGKDNIYPGPVNRPRQALA